MGEPRSTSASFERQPPSQAGAIESSNAQGLPDGRNCETKEGSVIDRQDWAKDLPASP